MRNWNSNTWVLAILSVVLVVVAIDYSRQFVKDAKALEAPSNAEAENPQHMPKFKVGDEAPDFSLANAKGVPQTLSKLVKRDTLLCFTCGCSNCRQLQVYLGALTKDLGAKAPDVITVTTSAPEAEQSYRRDVPLKHTMLYEPQQGPVMAEYKGHPCPRVYGLSKDRKVTWISSSLKVIPITSEIAHEMARHLGFEGAGDENSGKRRAPSWEVVVNGGGSKPAASPASAGAPKGSSPQGESLDLPPYLATPKVGGS